MFQISSRRAALMGLGVAAAAIGVGGAHAATVLTVQGATALPELAKRLVAAPRRRDFKTVPMILDDPDQWDHAALDEVIAYHGGPKQVWDNTELGGPWLNLMRNALNAQIWSFKHKDFLAVSATHGSAHLALLDQPTWEKYDIAKLTAGKLASNTLIVEQRAAADDPSDYESDKGVFSGHDNSVVTLQRRGVVFLACHNAIWEVTEKLMTAGSNPDKLSHEAMAAELTNHLIPGIVLTPGVVGTLPELQQAGFHYAA